MQSTGTIQHKTTAQDIFILVLSNSKENKQQSQKIYWFTHNRLQTNRLMGLMYNGSVPRLTDLRTRTKPSTSVSKNQEPKRNRNSRFRFGSTGFWFFRFDPRFSVLFAQGEPWRRRRRAWPRIPLVTIISINQQILCRVYYLNIIFA